MKYLFLKKTTDFKNLKYLFLLISLYLFLICSSIKISSAGQFADGVPFISTVIYDVYLPGYKMREGSFNVHVSVPKNHHIYLNKGKRESYIPLKFNFTKLREAKLLITPVSSPSGEYDKEVEAVVLRGLSDFTFLMDLQGDKLSLKNGLFFFIGYQICNDQSKICYMPQTIKINFPDL